MNKENKVFFGVKNVHYNIVTNDTAGSVAWGEAKQLPGLVSVGIDRKVDVDDFWADDGPFFIGSGVPTTELEVEIATLTEEFEKDVLGYYLDSKKMLVEDSEAEVKKIALAFEFTGDKKAVRRRFFYCQPQPISEDGKTVDGGKKTPTTRKMKLSVMSVPGTTITSVKTGATTSANDYDKFYTNAIALPVKTVSG